MSYNKPIHRIAIVGTGVIGASWAAQYLARGFDVAATDPATNAEANLRKYVDEAWEQLEAIGLSRSSGRKKVQSNRGLAHVPPASHGGRNMLAHSGPTAEKVSQFFMAAAVARR